MLIDGQPFSMYISPALNDVGAAEVYNLALRVRQVMLEDAQVDSPAVVMSPAAQVDSPAVVVSPAAGPSPEGVQPVLMPLPGTSAGLPYSSDVQDASQIPAGETRSRSVKIMAQQEGDSAPRRGSVPSLSDWVMRCFHGRDQLHVGFSLGWRRLCRN